MKIKIDLPENEILVRPPEISTITKFTLSDGSLQVFVDDMKRDPDFGFVTGTSIMGHIASVNLAYVLSMSKDTAISYCVETEDEQGNKEIIKHWYQFLSAQNIEVKKHGKKYFMLELDTFGLGMAPLYDNIIFTEDAQGSLDTYKDFAEEQMELEDITAPAENSKEKTVDTFERQ